MIIKQIVLSQPEKEKLIRIKAKTGIDNWNTICRWAFCWSLAQSSIPEGIAPASDSSVEMSWNTFGGEYADLYEIVLRQRCVNDGLGNDRDTLIKYFRLHLSRGINYLSSRDILSSSIDLLRHLQ